MRKYTVGTIWFAWVVFPIALFVSFAGAVDTDLLRVQEMIKETGRDWIAAETWASQLPVEERNRLCGLKIPSWYSEPEATDQEQGFSLPVRFDWRDHAGVTAVRNQGNCGSCWAFASLAAFESAIYIRTGQQYDLSEQQILSCNHRGYNCNGGWFDGAYEIMIDPGSVQESCMPYHQSDTEPCTQSSCPVAAGLQSWHSIPNNLDSLKSAILISPISVGMTVVDDFYYYAGGCYENPTDEAVNHGVLLVGWDDNLCGGAWIVKNSWGKRWGENGFAYIKYGVCKIGKGACQPDYSGGSPNPTPTPGHPPANLEVELLISGSTFTGGDFFKIGLGIRNIGNQLPVDIMVCLDVLGTYYFWPEWSTRMDAVSETLQAGQHYAEVIMEFTWPQGDFGSMDNINVLAGTFYQDSLDLIEYDMVSFGFY